MYAPVLAFGRHILNQIETGITKEWLETNGLGSYAMGTILGANTRRYHGLFVTTSSPNLRRSVLVNRVEESVLIHGRRVDCSCQEYPGTISPQGYLSLESFTYDPIPRWVISIDDLKIEKKIFLRTGEETAVVIYKHLMGPSVKLILRPFFSCRDHDSLSRQDHRFQNAIQIEDNLIHCSVQGQPDFYTAVVSEPSTNKGSFKIYPEGYWYNNLLYAQEEEEIQYQEDLYSPCLILAELQAGQEVALVFSKEKQPSIHINPWLEHELFLRRETLKDFPLQTPLAQRCAIAADQFLIQTPQGTRIIAGYPWQEDSIRESLISLPGITLATGRFEEARSILNDCSKLILKGLLPQRFYMNGNRSSSYYLEMDTPLWFIYAVQKYWEATKDLDFIKELKGSIEKILQAYQEGIVISDLQVQMEIRMDLDGLITGSSNKNPLTWMNGKVKEWLATPRKGKPVEVQALWYNALQFYSEISLKVGGTDPHYSNLAKRVRESFNMLFWNSQTNYLYDVIDGNAREGSIRPNALYAISLPYEILEADKFKAVMEGAWQHLYTSLGLRTLSPREPHFHGIHKGDEKTRISATHNGTVLPFLLGAFLTAYFKTYGREQKNKEQATHLLTPFVAHLSDAGLGSISEMFDGNSPHNPRGCVAEARAVAEILRVIKEEGLEI